MPVAEPMSVTESKFIGFSTDDHEPFGTPIEVTLPFTRAKFHVFRRSETKHEGGRLIYTLELIPAENKYFTASTGERRRERCENDEVWFTTPLGTISLNDVRKEIFDKYQAGSAVFVDLIPTR